MKKFIVVIAFLVLPATLRSENLPKKIIIDKTLTDKNISLFVEYLEDKDNRLNIASITGTQLKDKWQPFVKENPGFGYTKSTFWIRFTVENSENEKKDFLIQQEYSIIDYITLYIPQDGDTFKKVETGDRKTFHERPVEHRTFVFPLQLAAKTKKTYYMSFQTDGSMNFVLNIWNPESFNKSSFPKYLLLVFFYGIIFILIFYNFFIFISSRDPGYLFYVIFTFFILLIMMILNGTAYQFLWPDFPWWANYCLPVTLSFVNLSLLLFARDFMQMKIKDLTSYKVTRMLIYTSVLVLLLTMFLPYRYAIITAVLFTAISIVWTLIAGVKMTIRKNRTAYFFLSAWLLFLVGTLAYLAKSLGIFPTNFFTDWSLQIGTSAQASLLSFGLADRINQMRKELKVLNFHLEEKVEERTNDLQSAMEKLSETNKQLVETRDALWGEMELARKIQTVLLPDNPSIKGFQIAAYMKPADEVGGDYYDIINTGSKDWLVIGDVSGHGVPAGLIMMMVQTSIQIVLNMHPDYPPSELLRIINTTITRNIKKLNEDKYMTITVMACISGGTFYFSGLHQDIMVFRHETGDVELVETHGMWIGLVDDITGMNEDLSLKVNPGDVILLYTDGITESWIKGSIRDERNPETDMYGDDKLVEVFRSLGKESTSDIKKGIIESLKDYDCYDDVTFVIIKRD